MIKPLPSSEIVFEKVGKGLFRELTREEELVFYREILDKVKVNIYISQINDVNDLTQSRMIWMNKSCTDMTGYSIEEAYEMGFQFFLEVQHPDSVDVAIQAVDFHKLKEGDSFHGLMRQQDKHKKIFWYQGYSLLLHEKNGYPWQLLNGAVNIQDEIQTQLQLFELQKENMRIKNRLKITMLTKREKEVLCSIANGKSDREISEEAFISLNTVHTHRKNIHRKLGKTKTAELVVFASEIGLL
jgi:DNA-binding CsgD family transcriptional regulator